MSVALIISNPGSKDQAGAQALGLSWVEMMQTNVDIAADNRDEIVE